MQIEEIRLTQEEILDTEEAVEDAVFSGQETDDKSTAVANTATDKAIKKLIEYLESGTVPILPTHSAEALKKLVKDKNTEIAPGYYRVED